MASRTSGPWSFSRLSEEEIRAIAEHEHIPEIVALELGNCLIRGRDGELLVSDMVIETSGTRSGAAIWCALPN